MLLLRELEGLVETSRERSTLRRGWSRARHLFPSVFWSLCWHAAPAGLLERLLPHFELECSADGADAVQAGEDTLVTVPQAARVKLNIF